MAQTPVDLGTATSFAVLAAAGITNTGSTTITGDIGTYPTTTETGFPPGIINGTNHAGDAVTQGARSDAIAAYGDAAGRTPFTTLLVMDIGGLTITPGVYRASSSLGITGILTLDAEGDPNAVFIFQIGSTLITAPGSRVVLINGAQACNIFWQVGSSATLGVVSTTGPSVFQGTILANTSITANTRAVVNGRLLAGLIAESGAVTLDTNTITVSICAAPQRGISLW